MAIGLKGLNAMVDGIGQQATLYLTAYSGVGGTTKVGTSVLVTYVASVNGIADLSLGGGEPTITIPSGTTITVVRLQDTTSTVSDSLALANYTLPTPAYFPDGGNLIISSYELSVTS